MMQSRLPGPPGIFPDLPDAMVDLNTVAGVDLVKAQWRYHDAEIVDTDFRSVGDDLEPSGPPNRTYDVSPHAESIDYDDSQWELVDATDLSGRRGNGKVSFNWYRINITIPEKIASFDPTGSTVVFEVVVDDYAELWVDGDMPRVVGQAGGTVVAGFNSPNRIIVGRDVKPGQKFQLAVFGINAPISVSPENYIWLRTAKLDFYGTERSTPSVHVPMELARTKPGIDAIFDSDARLEQIAAGFVFTEGPVWVNAGYLLFSSPNTNTIYRWSTDGSVNVFRSNSGYSGFDIGEYRQPGSNGLTLDSQGNLTICQHGNRRIIKVEPKNVVSVVADQYEGKRFNSPNDLVYKSDGSLYFTDPPFGLPNRYDDSRKELPYSGVFRVKDGVVTLLVDDMSGPNGIAFSPDEKYLYVGNWDMSNKVLMRYPVLDDGTLDQGHILCDMTDDTSENAIDGMKVDQEGNIYATGPGGLWILSPEGEVYGVLKGPELPHNVAWGDADGRTLYLTARTGVYRIRAKISGIRP